MISLMSPHPAELVREMGYSNLKGVSVCLINMPLRESAVPNTPPQGPGLLAARLRQYGAAVTIVDLNAYRIKDEAASQAGKPNGRWLRPEEAEGLLTRHFTKHGAPDIIGLSGMITTLRWQKWATETCRRLVPEAFLVSGGGLATEIKEGLFGWIPALDAVLHSEGDDILLVLAKQVLEAKRHRRRSMIQVPQYLGEQNGRPRFLYAGDRPKNLDDLPFAAWDLLDQDVDGKPIMEWYLKIPVWGLAANNSSAAPFEMTRSLTAVSSRGCPYACAFCYRGAQGERAYRMRSPDNLVAEVQHWLKIYQLDFFGFNDDNFAVDRRRVEQLPKIFEPLGGLRWGTHTRLDEAADERADWMAAAGCVYIGFGAESASARVLERMNKGGFILRPRGAKNNLLTPWNGFNFPTTMVEGYTRCRQVGIHGNCTWIMGYPGEELADLKTSIAFMLWQKELVTAGLTPNTEAYRRAEMAVNRRMFVATAYPGTAMFKDPACRQILAQNFNISFSADGNPVADEALENYVLELDDADKVMHGPDGRPLNFGAMPENQFLEARAHVSAGQVEKVLEMS
jgi:radical SAM superfamily enzyme YgiQ (UPF0313 family)